MFKIQDDDDDDNFDFGDEDFLAAALQVEASQPKATKKRSSFEIGLVKNSFSHSEKISKSESTSIDLSSKEEPKKLPSSSSKKFKFKSTKDKSPPVNNNIPVKPRNYAQKFSTGNDSQESIVGSSQLSEELPIDQDTRVHISAQNIASFLSVDSPSIVNVTKNQFHQQDSELSPSLSPIVEKVQDYSTAMKINSDVSDQNSIESNSPEFEIRQRSASHSLKQEDKINVTTKGKLIDISKHSSITPDAIKQKELTSSAIFKISQDSQDSDLDLSLGESPLRENTPNTDSALSSALVGRVSSVFKAPQIEIKNSIGRQNNSMPTTHTESRPAQVITKMQKQAEMVKGNHPVSKTHNANSYAANSTSNANNSSNLNPNFKRQYEKASSATFGLKNTRMISQPSTPVKTNASISSPSVLGQGPQRVRVPVTPSTARQPAKRVVTPVSTKQGPRRVKRKFPGPAGILPKLADKTGFDDVEIPSEERISPDKNAPVLSQLSQGSEDQFGQGAWSAMTAELGPDSDAILANHNIATVLRKASKKQLPRGKVPLLCALIENVEILPNDASVILKDPTGKIKGTIHRDVIKDYQGQLQAGTVLILRQAGVFSPSGRAHYLNITPNNLVRIYSKLSDGEIDCTSLSELNITDLEKMAENMPESPMPLHSPMIGTGRLGLQNSPQLANAVGSHSRDTPLFNTTQYQVQSPSLQNTPRQTIRPPGYTTNQNSSQAMRPPSCVTPAGLNIRNRSVEYGNNTPLQGNIAQRTPRINGATPNVQKLSHTPVSNTTTARRFTPSTNNITTPKQRFNFKPVVTPSPILFDSPRQPMNPPCNFKPPVFEMKENTPVAKAIDKRPDDLWDDNNIDDAVLAGLDEDF